MLFPKIGRLALDVIVDSPMHSGHLIYAVRIDEIGGSSSIPVGSTALVGKTRAGYVIS